MYCNTGNLVNTLFTMDIQMESHKTKGSLSFFSTIVDIDIQHVFWVLCIWEDVCEGINDRALYSSHPLLSLKPNEGTYVLDICCLWIPYYLWLVRAIDMDLFKKGKAERLLIPSLSISSLLPYSFLLFPNDNYILKAWILKFKVWKLKSKA